MTPTAMILAAGFGTRLGDLTQRRPKPMLTVAGAPLCRWSVLWLRHHGVRRMVVNLHHLGEQIEAELGDGSELGVEILYSREQGHILGTGGGLRHARALLDQGEGAPIIVVNAKILIDLDLTQVVARHREAQAEATMVLRPDPQAERWGSLELAPDGRVARLLGARPHSAAGLASVGEPLMFTGVHVIEPRFLDRIPPTGEQCVIRTAYRSLFDEAKALFGWRTERYWWEHSTPERYRQGVANVLDGAVALPFAERAPVGVDPRARVDVAARIMPPVHIGPGAVIEAGATVGPHTQIDAGGRVAAGATVRSSIVWSGALAQGEVTDTVVTGA